MKYSIKRFSSLQEKLFFLNPVTGEAITGKEINDYVKESNDSLLSNGFDASEHKINKFQGLAELQKSKAEKTALEESKKEEKRRSRKANKEFQSLPGKDRKSYLEGIKYKEDNEIYSRVNDYETEAGKKLKAKYDQIDKSIPQGRLKKKLKQLREAKNRKAYKQTLEHKQAVVERAKSIKRASNSGVLKKIGRFLLRK